VLEQAGEFAPLRVVELEQVGLLGGGAAVLLLEAADVLGLEGPVQRAEVLVGAFEQPLLLAGEPRAVVEPPAGGVAQQLVGLGQLLELGARLGRGVLVRVELQRQRPVGPLYLAHRGRRRHSQQPVQQRLLSLHFNSNTHTFGLHHIYNIALIEALKNQKTSLLRPFFTSNSSYLLNYSFEPVYKSNNGASYLIAGWLQNIEIYVFLTFFLDGG
jgi:hypothetical protein